MRIQITYVRLEIQIVIDMIALNKKLKRQDKVIKEVYKKPKYLKCIELTNTLHELIRLLAKPILKISTQ
jgi:hypothetical protein